MKKNLLLTLSVILLLFSSCTKTKNQENRTNKSNEVVTTTNSQIESSTERKIVESNEQESLVVTNENVTLKNKELTEVDLLRKKHEEFLNNSPFKKSMALNKTDRKAAGLPPNKYYEQEWELSMNPSTGRPSVENLHRLRKEIADQRAADLASGRTPGDASDNNWVERGPNNVGGRVRAVMFDPNDPTFKTVFAGGVSGGLWKNTDITSAATVWTRVNIPDNLAVSSIAVDPNNSNTFYVGTGESYVGGDVNGDGVWKSTDGGTTWTNIFGGITGPTTFESAANVVISAPGGIAGSYACYPTTAFGTPITTPIPGDIVLVSNTNPLGCNANPITNNVSGKIALIRRGSCTFVEKVKNAQTAGAIAVIMMNNVDGTPVAMGGTDGTITIPSVMISKADGDILEAAALSGTVSGSLTSGPGTFTGNLVPGQQHINAIKVRNNGGTSEIYVAAGDSFYGAANSATYLGGPGFGLYKSTNGGTSWTELSLPLTAGGKKHCPNDIEIAADNKIWVSTTSSTVYGDGGGKIFSSNDGVTFTDRYTVANGDRTQIAVSRTVADKVYVLAELTTTAAVGLYRTTNAFGTTTTLALPTDADSGVGADFTRGQAFYDLMLEVDPNNDQTVYTGGIDLFKSTNGGTSWSQFSHWYGGFGYQNVHADQHAMAFAPGSSTRMVFGNDGGVYYSNNSGTTTSARNNGLNITQFYSVGVAPTGATGGNLSGEHFAAGAQDNGTQYFGGVGGGINSSVESQGGDGAFTMFDQGADKYYISNYVYNENITYRPVPSGATRTIDNDNNGNNGAFIAPMVLDSNRDVLYSDYSNGTTYQIRRYRNLKSGIVNRANLTDALLTASPTAFAVSPYTTATTTLLVGTRLGKLLKVTNADGLSGTPAWTEITGPSFVGSMSDIEFGQTENDIFVTMHNYNVVSVWYSSNGGTTWQNKEGNLPDLPVKCILQNPLNLNEVIIGTELGVWYTNTFATASPIWKQSYNGMSNVKVVDLDLRNDNTVFAATYGRGLFSGVFTSPLLSSNDVSLNDGVKIYPNPSKGNINISINNYSGSLKVNLLDLNGRQVYSNEFNDFSLEKSINIENYQSGVYLMNLEGEGIKLTRKIIFE